MSSLKQVEHLQIPLSAILSATDNFDKKNFIALGGYGKVYKGQSEQYGSMAVKRLYLGSQQGQHEFMMEIALLSAYKHENLVSLVGFCDQDGEKILVYKHESNGSLDKYLRSKDLNWIQRLQIFLDAARGLKYLHDDVGPQHRVLHRDVKSSNILLDENWKAKISDFGLSKISPANVPFTFLISNACGTIGYVDPEYVNTGVLTQKSDVFSFGVVLFEVLCGRPARLVEHQDERHFLFRLAQNHYEKETLNMIMDSELQKQMRPSSLGAFSSIAYQCLKKCREDRPTMSQIVEQLQRALDYQLAGSSGLGHDAALHHSLSTSKDKPRSSSSRSWAYDVCINYVNKDLRSACEVLSSALQQKGVHIYMDIDDHKGESIYPSLFIPIRDSQVIIFILSVAYASSRWCLDKLEYVMQSKDDTEQICVPIFYDVNPLDVRNQQGDFGEVFTIHNSRHTKAELWRKVLRDVADIPGWTWSDVMKGREFIQVITDIIPQEVLPSSISPVGIETRMQDLKLQLQVGLGGVRMVGICGPWGSGKSTLASSIYEKIDREFEGCCCIIRDVSAESRMYGLQTLQEKVLSNVLKPRKAVLWSTGGGISKMKRRLCSTRVLIVLDEVDHLDHLKMLAGSQDWFGEGSRIIIITRNEDLLKTHNIKIIYNARLLNEDEAIELFSMHAFFASRPARGYKKISLNMVSKLGGHPSALKSLGSFLHDKDMNTWIRTLARLEDIPVNEIVDFFKPGDDGAKKDINSWLGLEIPGATM